MVLILHDGPRGPPVRRDVLHQLPNELLLDILRSCDDFTSLWSLINTSPRLSSIFQSRALEIVEALLESTVPTPIRSLMRAVVRIRTGSFECQTWEEAREFSMTGQTSPSQPLGPATSPVVLQKFVGLTHKIQVLAHSCIDRCFQRCVLISMKPEPCTDPSHSHPRGGGRQRFRAKDLRSPSWMEEQRALLAFWRLQYFFELKIGRLQGRLGWASRDLIKMQASLVETFYSGFQRQQVLTAIGFVAELRSADGGVEPPSERRSPCLGRSRSQQHPTFQLPNPARGINSSWAHDAPLPLSRVAEQDDDEWVGHRDEGLLKRTIGWCFLSMYQYRSYGRLRDLPRTPYRKFGLFFWDEKMMVDLELWPDKDYNPKDGYKYYHTWRNIIGEDEATKAVDSLEDD